MADDTLKFTPARIDKYISGFRSMRENPTNRNQATFMARGAYLSAIRDSLDTRLKAGWDYIRDNPEQADAADLWFDLLERYETINKELEAARSMVSLEEAARSIFNAVTYDDQSHGISLGVAE